MEGDIIFNKESEKKENPTQGVAPLTPPPAVQAQPVKPLPPPPSKSFPGLIPKILIGVVGLALFGFIIFKFIVPLFGGGSKEVVTLTYWGLWESESVMAPVIKEFESKNPKIKIKYLKQDIKQYSETLQTRVNNGTGPDVYRFHSTWLPMLRQELLPLSGDVIKPEDFKKKYYPVTQQDLVRNGAIYGIPLEIDTLAMFVNTEILEEAGVAVPGDWNDFVKAAVKVTVKESNGKIKTSGASLGGYDNITHAPDILGMLFMQNGTNIKDMTKTKASAVETLEFYTSFAKGSGKMWDETLEEALVAFAKGNVGFYFGYSWDVFQIDAINPELKYKIQKVPGLPGRRMSVASYWVEGISTKSKHPKEAMEFMKYLAKSETVEKLYATQSKTRDFGEPYPLVELKDKLKGNEKVYPFVEQGPSAVSTYFVSNTNDTGINGRMNAYLGNAVRSVLGNTSPDSAVDTLSSGISQVLGMYETKPTVTR